MSLGTQQPVADESTCHSLYSTALHRGRLLPVCEMKFAQHRPSALLRSWFNSHMACQQPVGSSAADVGSSAEQVELAT